MAVMGEFVRKSVWCAGCEQDQNHAAFFLRSAQRFFIAKPIFLRAAADR
jgi:hypothetical protein